LERRSDLVLRPLPELRMCMVYRPRPARIVTLNPTGWMLLELCNGETVEEIEAAYGACMTSGGGAATFQDARQGLQILLEHQLVRKLAVSQLQKKREEK